MHAFKFFGTVLVTVATAGVACAAQQVSGFEGFPVVDDRELDQMRGGFETVSNGIPLSFSLGIERTSFVNGQLVATSTVVIPSLAAAMNGGGVTVTGDPITVIQNGPGNSFALSSISDKSAQFMTVIQNTLDNQVISNVTRIDVSITSKDFLRSLAVQQSLSRMTFSSFH